MTRASARRNGAGIWRRVRPVALKLPTAEIPIRGSYLHPTNQCDAVQAPVWTSVFVTARQMPLSSPDRVRKPFMSRGRFSEAARHSVRTVQTLERGQPI